MQISRAAILSRLVLTGTLVFATIAFLGEAWRQERACPAVSPPDAPVLAWRLGTPPVERLRGFLDAAHRLLPRGALVGFASPEGPDGAAFIRRLWAAYLAPDLNILDAADAHAYTRYVLAYGVRLDRAGVSLVRPLPGGGLYRLGPP